MLVSHKISFQIGEQFEQHTAIFTIEDKDIPNDSLDKLNLMEKMLVFNTFVVLEGLLYQYAEGYIDREALTARKKRLFSLLKPKPLALVNSLLGGSNEGS